MVAYLAVNRRIRSLGRDQRAGGDNHVTRTESVIAMKLLLVMVLFVLCWTPATVMLLWQGEAPRQSQLL